MFTRLYLARNLLQNDGVIFVSIDDNELYHLRVLMNEIFGEENYVNTITIRTKPSAGASGGGEDKRLKKNAEYLLMYVKNMERISQFSQVTTQEPLLDVIEEMRDNEESWKYTSIMLDADSEEFLGEISDGEGNPIKIYKRKNLKRTTINKIKAGAVRAMYDLSFEFVIFNIDQWKSTLLAVPTVTKTLDWTNGIRKLITNGLIPWIIPGMEADIIERGPNKGFPSGLSDVLRTTPYLSTGYGLWQLGTNWKDLEDDLASGRGQ